ncbi:hypothetical protein GCM10007216_08760 [Thalassobacillus devorans]|uniref:Uncharacterized protein n=1 Tax=Thalassobacillus devorans TaxID=279813 RepID=A0ABQ1NPV8_9BACI|nr:hypothetical protein [Thalassobacillus devorans]NIK27787.1 hypothetical protein [Thalassobacillus devorans]GGC80438.1 hypothetical protein GCM10007216_08760 [Thalassobacillus devorans]
MTDHERAWEKFTNYMKKAESIRTFEVKSFTGLPFIYIQPQPETSQQDLEELLKRSAAGAMKGKRLTLAMSFVRKSQAFYVYRVRFLVPQRKMFCCGNLCDDCIRFTDPL